MTLTFRLDRSPTSTKRHVASTAVLLFMAMHAGAEVAAPLVSLPPDVGQIANAVGEVPSMYEQREFFVEGQAHYYNSASALKKDGRWITAESSTTSPYKVRMVTRLPKDPARFNGTVIVEWLNVTSGVEAGVNWVVTHEELTRKGYAWVGVGVQWVGVESPASTTPGATSLKVTDPVRYGSLHHPGDAYSYDIYSQMAQALRRPQGVDPLGTLRPGVKKMIAVGQSQSANRLATYINGVHQHAKVYDGFLVHSRILQTAPLSESKNSGFVTAGSTGAAENSPPDVASPNGPTRDDVSEPVFQVQTETDVTLGTATRRADDAHFRLWELTGTAHVDAYTLNGGHDARTLTTSICGKPGEAVWVNTGPQTYAVRAALHHLNSWVTQGVLPPVGQRISTSFLGTQRDAKTKIALGGVRLPDVEVPTRTLRGDRIDLSSIACILSGRTDPWNGDTDAWDKKPNDPSGSPEPTLKALYGTKQKYVDKFIQSTKKSVTAGYVLPEDEAEVAGFAATVAFP